MKRNAVPGMCVLVISMIFLLFGCGPVNCDTVAVKALYGKNVFELPIKSQQDGYLAHLSNTGDNRIGACFDTSLDWNGVLSITEKTVGKMPGGSITYPLSDWHGNQEALISIESNGKRDYFLLSQTDHAQYLLSAMGAEIMFEDRNAGETGLPLLLPVHFISDARIAAGSPYGLLAPRIFEGVEYELIACISSNDFLDFYSDSGWFGIEEINGSILLYPPDIDADLDIRTPVTFAVTISFATHVDTPYFKIEKAVSLTE